MQDIIKRIEEKSNPIKSLLSIKTFLYLELHIYLLINNIDGMNFRNTNVQNIFKSAAQCSYIHILATIDHIHGPLSKIKSNHFFNSISFYDSLESTESHKFSLDMVCCSYMVNSKLQKDK
jgi:hypothetical protein